ncbi:hypothetical protein PN36_26795 [Candidatus Thiomargarita nelsonii]|uniref:Thiol:disulfide interchange protein n=1 Tax=Candidatus Thiomargarita nelsonii TaxID=1003181 RepID=A0A0A6P6L2_9GAMM|nr:hypothetical protein PN36_26795 [Candidatus Thiomargarita nelsonii]
MVEPSVPVAVTETVKRVQQLLRVKNDKVSVAASPITGLYEVVIGGEVIYISADGRYFVTGNIFESKSRRNLTDEKRGELRVAALNALKDAELVVFAPETETRHTINVFTDVDCAYCSKFHNEVPELNKAGIKVRYLAFPRAGVGSKTYNTMVSVWCAEDQQQAMTDAKARREVKPATCENPVAQQYELGQRIGITGTPAMVLSDGELVPGYVPAKKLIAYLQQKSMPFSQPRQ